MDAKEQVNPATYRRVLITIAGLLFINYIYHLLTAPATTFDDAYMFIRYALNLLSGYGYAWNRDGVQTFGCTSIAYTYLVAAGKFLFPWLSDSKLLVFLCGILGLVSIAILGYTIQSITLSSFLKRNGWLLIAIFLLGNRLFYVHTIMGMDTMFSFLSNCLFILSLHNFLKKQTSTSAIVAAFSPYLTFLVRPDNGIYMLCFPALFFLFLYKGEKKPVAVFIMTLALLLVVDSVIKYNVFGDILPLTYYAKKSGFYDGYTGAYQWNPLRYIFWFMVYTSPLWMIALITYEKDQRRILLVYGVPVIITFLYYFTVVQIMGFYSRFYFPSMPFFIIGSILIIDRSLQKTNYSKSIILRLLQNRISLAIVSAIIVCLLYPLGNLYEAVFLNVKPIGDNEPVINPTAAEFSWEQENIVMAGLCRKLPASTVIAASEHGLLGSENPAIEIIDLTGLHDPEIAHNGFTMEYLLKRSPDIIWMPHYHYTGQNSIIKQNAQFQSEYQLFPNSLGYGMAIKKSKPEILEIFVKANKTL